MALGCSECDDDDRDVDGFDEDCGDVGEGILKLYPSRWAPKMIRLRCLRGLRPTQTPQYDLNSASWRVTLPRVLE